jgi:hypothetical protein
MGFQDFFQWVALKLWVNLHAKQYMNQHEGFVNKIGKESKIYKLLKSFSGLK